MARVHARLDTLAEAVRYGHSIGLEVHAWVAVNEDDHGRGIRSRFAGAHPETRWVRRDRTPCRSQQGSAFPEVVRHKLGIVEEILSGYAIDGLLVGWMRAGDVRDDPQTDAEGVADHGYEAPLVATFRGEHGIDPASLPNGDDRWVRARARPQTELMRGVRALVAARRPGASISVLVAHPWCYRGPPTDRRQPPRPAPRRAGPGRRRADRRGGRGRVLPGRGLAGVGHARLAGRDERPGKGLALRLGAPLGRGVRRAVRAAPGAGRGADPRTRRPITWTTGGPARPCEAILLATRARAGGGQAEAGR